MQTGGTKSLPGPQVSAQTIMTLRIKLDPEPQEK
jgi:hypothetical protein